MALAVRLRHFLWCCPFGRLICGSQQQLNSVELYRGSGTMIVRQSIGAHFAPGTLAGRSVNRHPERAACDATTPQLATNAPVAPACERARPNWINLSRSSVAILMAPGSGCRTSKVAAFDCSGDFPTAVMSSICNLTNSPNFVSRPIRELIGVSLRSTDSSAKRGQRSASSRRRKVSLTYRPLRRTYAGHEPEGSFAMVGISCAIRVQ